MNTPVSFPIAKLLKEKEYKDKNVLGAVRLSEPKYYDPNGIIHSIKDIFEETDYKIEDCYNAPTIADVVMWLYEKHGIWIQTPFSHNDVKPFCWVINKTLRNISEEDEDRNCWLSGIDTEDINGWDSPTEAYEAAIEYTLNNLI